VLQKGTFKSPFFPKPSQCTVTVEPEGAKEGGREGGMGEARRRATTYKHKQRVLYCSCVLALFTNLAF